MTGPGGRSDEHVDNESPVEAYLDRLLVELRAERPRQARHLLAEAEAHLRDATQEAVDAGMTLADAEAAAVARFGPAAALAEAERARQRTPFGTLVRQGVMSAWFLGAFGATAVGVSGLIAAVLRAVGGERFVADVVPGRVLTASDCARWLAISPRAASCRAAAISDWAAETVYYRIALGILGALAMVAFVVARRRLGRVGAWTSLPAPVVDTVAVTLFGLSGVWLLVQGLDAVVVRSGHGAGQWLSAAPVALAAAAVFAVRLLGDLRRGDPASLAT
jgi:hypothetical protein